MDRFHVLLKVIFAFGYELTIWTWKFYTFVNGLDVILKVAFQCKCVLTLWAFKYFTFVN